jgi:hypothetical protein
VLHEIVGTADVTELGKSDLGNNSAKLAGSGRDAVGSGTVTGGEDLSRNDEGRDVGAKVLEEVRQTVEEDESLGSSTGGSKLLVCETHDNESAGKDSETHELYRLAPPDVDDEEGSPISRNETGDGEDQVTDGDVVQVVVDLLGPGGVWGTETDGGQDDGGVETKTIESNLNGV